MNEVIFGRDVVIVVASVLIGGVMTSDDGLVDDTSMKGAITGGVDVFMNLWVGCTRNSSSMCSGSGPDRAHVLFSGVDAGMITPDVTVDVIHGITFSDVSYFRVERGSIRNEYFWKVVSFMVPDWLLLQHVPTLCRKAGSKAMLNSSLSASSPSPSPFLDVLSTHLHSQSRSGGVGLDCLTGVVVVGFLGVACFVAGCTLALS
ncbi:hypothetical protein Tco_0858340 [Tanacetum coccineum]|uniref:Uncharacterized protein n=1 Tax=Tanacetum coccineum TaxID=301880 RepID=A0ABQ5BCV8_9ASTR